MQRNRALLVALGCGAALSCAHGKSAEEEVQAQKPRLPEPLALSIFQPPLWERWLADKGSPRLLVLASPSSQDSLHGISVIQRDVLRTAPRSLRTYIIWVPAEQDDDRISSTAASGAIGDEQAAQFWDDGGQLARALGAILPIPGGLAYNVYLLYAPGADATAPPYLWMQLLPQVPVSLAPRLDGKRLRARVDELVPPGRR